MANNKPMVGRTQVRSTLCTFIAPPQVDGISQVMTTFPKRATYQKNALVGEKNRCIAVVFIESETESRVAVGGAFGGWKRVDYGVAIQLFHHSVERNAEDAMADFDNTVDNLKEKLRSDHNFGDPSGTLVWQGAEPVIDGVYGESFSENGTSIETWASLHFTVTQMIQA